MNGVKTSPDLSRRVFLTAAAGVVAASLLDFRPAEGGTLPPALFVAAHPDDETLAMGVALAEHIAAGQDVHVLWLTRGEASGVRKTLGLDVETFGQARIREATAAMKRLGPIVIHEAHLPDGGVTQAAAQEAIVAVADQIAPGKPIRIKTHSAVVENHPDHLAAAQAAKALKASDPARFGDLRHYILPAYWSDTRLSKVAEHWDYPASSIIRYRTLNACHEFDVWNPPYRYAIGYKSVGSMFTRLTNKPRSLYHA